MIALVGKANPNPHNGEIEIFLQQFRAKLTKEGGFVYVWSFNPDSEAIQRLRSAIDKNEDVFLYLPDKNGNSKIRFHIQDFLYNQAGLNNCPEKWRNYCIDELQNINWLAHMYFLIDNIELLNNPVDIYNAFHSIFDKYQGHGRNFFAFLTVHN